MSLLTFSLLLVTLAAAPEPVSAPVVVSEQARRVHAAAIVVDTHADTTQRLVAPGGFDLGVRHTDGNLDIPRMREGGVGAQFFSIWVPSDVTGPAAIKRSLQQMDAVREAVRTHSSDLELATTAEGVRQAHKQHRIAVLMGVEGGHMIDSDLGVLRMYATLGVRYMTLTHFKNNEWADSSTDKPTHDGLTAFGKDVVREMNRLGMVVDISHVADKTFFDAIEVSKAPVIASHSSCRALSNHVRNMTDDMLRALAKNGGVVMINYDTTYLSEELRAIKAREGNDVVSSMDAAIKACGGDDACATLASTKREQELTERGVHPRVSWEKIVEHIDHAVKIAGIDHVGLGSDFDGATMPSGMEDVSMLPRLTDALLKKGYSPADVTKILGANLLRVMDQTERAAGAAK